MQSFTSKLNVWQEVSSIEALNTPKNPHLAYPTAQEDSKNNTPQETWFELLQYPAESTPTK